MQYNYDDEEFNGYQKGAEQDEYSEQEDSYTQFRRYTESEMIDRWGDSDIKDMLMEIESILEQSRKFFFSKRKRVVDGEELTNLSLYAQQRLPGDLEEAKRIKTNSRAIIDSAKMSADDIVKKAESHRESVVADAQAQANRIIEDAQKRANEMVAAHSITQAARVNAEKIQSETRQWEDDLRKKTREECVKYIDQVMSWAAETVNGANEYVQTVMKESMDRLGSTYAGIEGALRNFDADAKKNVSYFSKGPNIKPGNM